MKTVAVLQPSFLPWIGFFDQMAQSDVFVIYDDVQYDKNGWRNRNRIRTPEGWQWLTVPVLTKGKATQKILEVQINNGESWEKKHLKAIEQNYRKAPYFHLYFPELQKIYAQPWDRLVELNMALIHAICKFLELSTSISFSSKMDVSGDRVNRLIDLCKSLEATHYLTGDKAQDYLDETAFEQNAITVRWHHYEHPTYGQLHQPFVSQLSIIDLLFNHGPNSLDILKRKKEAPLCLQS